MANSKDKPKAKIRPTFASTKAGRYSNGGGKNRGRNGRGSAAQNPLLRKVSVVESTEDKTSFYQEQAALALQLLSELETGSLAHKVAVGTIELYASIMHSKSDPTTRTSAAIQAMRLRLTVNELGRTKAIQLGIDKARKALKRAFEELNKPDGVAYTSASSAA